ncbi:dienelactone hydrolase family protein [Candidatus Poriferisodalis sp.]|uniref:dienelactone hydrolase family protein n=1 Tax=Candidatus Poriferisodalis sp. TaxID=3101277 RepID=UPI003B5C32FD
MFETHVALDTGDGEMSTFIVHPEITVGRPGPFPTVLFLMDAPGKRDELLDMARRIATVGYYVMLPNLYYRETPGFTVLRDDPASVEFMFAMMSRLTNAMVASDAQAMLDHAETESAASTERVGTTGYCMTGPMAIWLAAEFPETIAAAISVHGVRLAVDADDSPHRRVADIKGEVLILAAEFDDYVDRAHYDRLCAAFDEAGTNAQTHWLVGTHHGFVFPQRFAYDKHAAERHWELLHDLFDRQLS